MYVVMGATGHTGSVVAKTLLEQKQPIRVVLRDAEKGGAWKARGAEIAVASYEDVRQLTNALREAKGVYLLVPPNYGAESWLEAQKRFIDHAAAAVTSSGVPHVVFLSSIGGHLGEGTGPIRALHYGEERLQAAAQHVTLLRPCYFIDNWGLSIGSAKAQGMLPTFIRPDTKIPMIFTRDIGRIAAEQLGEGGRGRKVVELAGPEDYSPDQVASALGRIFGRPVAAQPAPLSAVVPTFKSFGLADEAARLYEEMYRAIATDVIRYEFPGSVVRGRVSLEEALQAMVSTV
jgi:uncharacterized protein YbjT (DUF2867 family)